MKKFVLIFQLIKTFITLMAINLNSANQSNKGEKGRAQNFKKYQINK
jgi:hypothetical protein